MLEKVTAGLEQADNFSDQQGMLGLLYVTSERNPNLFELLYSVRSISTIFLSIIQCEAVFNQCAMESIHMCLHTFF